MDDKISATYKLCLASASPRRSGILKQFGYDFSVVVSGEDENIKAEFSPEETAMTLALSKALSVYKLVGVPTLGADTVVVVDGKIIGKPDCYETEKKYLKMLSNRKHTVVTGFALLSENQKIVNFDTSTVSFNNLSDSLIEKYAKSGLGMDKAGGYGAQDGYNLVKEVEGSLYNVIGLPIEKIKPFLDGIIGNTKTV